LCVGVLREVSKLYKYEEENVKLCIQITAYTSLVCHRYDEPIADPMVQTDLFYFSYFSYFRTLEISFDECSAGHVHVSARSPYSTWPVYICI
jgi:hypothetical protein